MIARCSGTERSIFGRICTMKTRARAAWLEAMADFTETRLGWIGRLSRPRLRRLADERGVRLERLIDDVDEGHTRRSWRG